MSRLPYLTKTDLPEEHEELFEVDEENPDDVLLNVHRVMANNPRLLEAWGEWMWTLYDETGDTRIRELVILAVAYEVESRYVWHQHVALSMENDVSREEILAVSQREFEVFTPAEKAVLEYATTLVTGSLDDETHDGLREFFTDDVVVAIILLASEYLQMSKAIDAMAVDLETAFVGWELERLEG